MSDRSISDSLEGASPVSSLASYSTFDVFNSVLNSCWLFSSIAGVFEVGHCCSHFLNQLGPFHHIDDSSVGALPLVAISAGFSSDGMCLKQTPSSAVISLNLLVTNTDSGFLVTSQWSTLNDISK